MNQFIKDINITSTAVIFLTGVLTAFLWFPLLPILVPLVTLVIGLRWISATLFSEAHLGKKTSSTELLYFPITKQTPPSQASQPTAWSPSAGRPSPAGPGSLPSRKDPKSFKRRLRESRHIVRVMNGLDLRKSASANT